MSLVEILRVLYDDFLHCTPLKLSSPDRDRFILSKGHGCLALYAVLADKGFISLDSLDSFTAVDSILGGHPERGPVPGVEASTGALGHGLSIAVGMALAARIKKLSYRVVVVTGDGELNEGSCWEAMASASKHRLSNLHVFIDRNRMQCYGDTTDVAPLEPLREKIEAFGLEVIEVDGHDVKALREVTKHLEARGAKLPSAVICNTVKGKGIAFAENNPQWHYKFELTQKDINDLYKCLDLRPSTILHEQ
jgi:transketolase